MLRHLDLVWTITNSASSLQSTLRLPLRQCFLKSMQLALTSQHTDKVCRSQLRREREWWFWLKTYIVTRATRLTRFSSQLVSQTDTLWTWLSSARKHHAWLHSEWPASWWQQSSNSQCTLPSILWFAFSPILNVSSSLNKLSFNSRKRSSGHWNSLYTSCLLCPS